MISVGVLRPMLPALLMVLASVTANAQIRPAFVKNVDEPGRVPYQHMVEFNPGAPVCGGALCIVAFPAVPAGKRLVLEHVTGLIAVSGGQPQIVAMGDFGVTNQGNVAILSNAFSNTGFTTLGSTFYAMDKAVRVYYEAGTTPKLKIIYSGNVAFIGNASVHGYLIDAAN